MSSLADTQSRLRDAVVNGDFTGVVPLLIGGRHVERRLAIHHRHYETSLVTALLGTFPATGWLMGVSFLTEAARHFVRWHPPQVPCIAEYGERFPAFLSTVPGAERAPYLREFTNLEWSVGQVSIAVDRPPVTIDRLSAIGADALPDVVLTLQSGLRYLHVHWPVDRLIELYVTETAPDQLSVEPEDAWLEVRGSRGELSIKRLDAAHCGFRSAIVEGLSLGDAAERILQKHATFDAGHALTTLVGAGLVTAIRNPVSAEQQQ